MDAKTSIDKSLGYAESSKAGLSSPLSAVVAGLVSFFVCTGSGCNLIIVVLHQ